MFFSTQKKYTIKEITNFFKTSLFDLTNLSEFKIYKGQTYVFLNLKSISLDNSNFFKNIFYDETNKFIWYFKSDNTYKNELYEQVIVQNKKPHIFIFNNQNQNFYFQYLGLAEVKFYNRKSINHEIYFLYEFISYFVSKPKFISEIFNTNFQNAKNNLSLADKLNLRFDELDISVRLANCLKADNIIYLKDLVVLDQYYLSRIPNFGQTTLDEVVGILQSFNLTFNMDLKDQTLEIKEKVLKKSHEEKVLCLMCLPITYLKPSTRMVNVFKNLNINIIYDLLNYSHYELLRVPNFGRSSLRQVNKNLQSLHADLCIPFNFLENDHDLISKYRNDKKFIASHFNDEYDIKPSKFFNEIKFFIEKLFIQKTIKENEYKVLFARFGLADGKLLTLEEIGENAINYGFNQIVTRERVRQIEAKGLRKIDIEMKSKFLPFVPPSLKLVTDYFITEKLISIKKFIEMTGIPPDVNFNVVFFNKMKDLLNHLNIKLNLEFVSKRINGRDLKFLCVETESQTYKKLLNDIILESNHARGFGNFKKIKCNFSEADILKFFDLTNFEFLNKNMEYFWFRSLNNRILRRLYKLFSIKVSLDVESLRIAFSKCRSHDNLEEKFSKILDHQSISKFVNFSSQLCFDGKKIKATNYKKLNYLSPNDVLTLKFALTLKQRQFNIKELHNYMKLNEISETQVNYWTHYCPWIRNLKKYIPFSKKGSIYECLFNVQDLRKNDLVSTIDEDIEKFSNDIIYQGELTKIELITGKIISDNFIDYEGNYKIKFLDNLESVNIKKNNIDGLKKVFLQMNLKEHDTIFIEKLQDQMLEISSNIS